MKKHGNIITIILLIVYLTAIIYITCICRTVSFSKHIAPYPFWSFIEVYNGNLKIGIQIIGNFLLFIPLGFLFKFYGLGKKQIILLGLFISFLIEISQLFFHLGLFEIDDIASNTLGTVLGIGIYDQLKISEIKKSWISAVGVLIIILLCVLFNKPEGDIPEKVFYFGINRMDIEEKNILIKGYCFSYANPSMDYTLLLNDGKNTIEFLTTDTRLSSENVDEYFKCGENYSSTGFTAKTSINMDETYEIFVEWENGIIMSTRTYIKNDEVMFSLSNSPDFQGKLLLAHPEFDFYVFQKDNDLYWLCGDKFPFEKNKSQFIELMYWTTQEYNLPKNRLENGCTWDSQGFDFTDYEIESFEEYRVAKRALPTDYSVTTILTGCYKYGKWIWRDYFRPLVLTLQ